ncbi:unnamed protein product [Brassica napus]|uniref:(rape) hypothetical protein n=1 Tax=Brassica napus TaxID=3708 RepID=A0A816LKR5_BRANA|nr:unnamed protein product [Brassica napus]
MMKTVRMLLTLLCLVALVYGQPSPDTATMFALRDSLKSEHLNWSDPNPCVWTGLGCDTGSYRVSRIQIVNRGISGTLTCDIRNLSALTDFDVMGNNLTVKIPSLAGLKFLERVLVKNNGFTSIDADFFTGLSSLQFLNLDKQSVASLADPLQLNRRHGYKKTGSQVPYRGNQLTGIVPESLTELTSLSDLAFGNNLLQGPTPSFKSKSINLDMTRLNSFCLDVPGAPGDPHVNDLLSIVEGFGFPVVFAESLKGNYPCNSTNKWVGLYDRYFHFGPNVVVVHGDPGIRYHVPPPVSGYLGSSSQNNNVAKILGSVIGSTVLVLLLIEFVIFLCVKEKKAYHKMHPQQHSGD